MKVADLALFGTAPEDADEVADRGVIAPDESVAFFFNANLDPATVEASEIEVLDASGAVVATVEHAVDAENGDTDAILITSTAMNGFAPGEYTARLKSGSAFSDLNGGAPITFTADEDVRFIVE